jgi:hypothetical protein
MASPSTVTPDTEPLEYTIKLFDSDKSTVIHLRPGKDLFSLKSVLLSSTTWFPYDLPPSRIVLFQEGDNGKIDLPTVLSESCTLIVRQLPKDVISLQVSDDRGYVRNPWIRPVIKESSFGFVDSQVKHILIADTSVVKAVMLGEINTLPVADHLCWISSKKVFQECNADSRIPRPIISQWPTYINDCSRLIQGFTPGRFDVMFEMLYRCVLQDKEINTKYYPSFMDFNDSDDYENTCNDVGIYLEALVLSKYAQMSLKRPVKVSFVTFDYQQGSIAAMCQNDPIARKTLKLLVEEKDISDLNILTLRSRTFPDL